MATKDTNLAERSGNLLEAHKSYDPRIVFFYFALALLLLTLVGGLGYQQLTRVGDHAKAERQQNQRRVLFPGPRGNIYDRNGKLLVGNNHRFAVLLHLDELKSELRTEWRGIYNNFKKAGGKKELPSDYEIMQIARVTLVQRYLERVNRLLGRDEKVDAAAVKRHFRSRLLLPYELVPDLTPVEYARLIEGLPVNSPLEVYAFNVRFYPHGEAAAHVLGYVRPTSEIEADDFPGKDLHTFPMKGTSGRDGLELWFDSTLEGQPGGRIYRVDPSGYKINPPLASRTPVQGKHLVASLDLDIQLAAEEAIGDRIGAAAVLDVATGEVLALVSKPSYDLSKFSPRASVEVVAGMNERAAWTNYALNGFYPPGSTFKILTSIAALRSGAIAPDSDVECFGTMRIGGRLFVCNNHTDRGRIDFPTAIAKSCNIFFYRAGLAVGPDALANEARRFHLDRPTGIELPSESSRMLIPDPAWHERTGRGRWFDGNTANMAIGQDALQLSPLQMACLIASVARGETFTQPSIVHDPGRAPQKHERIGLADPQYAALMAGFEMCVISGSARVLSTPAFRIPGVRMGGKTGTAQKIVTIDGKTGIINYAWFVGFAPLEKPQIAIAVMLQGEQIGEDYGGGHNAAPVAGTVLKKYFEKKNSAAAPPPPLLRSE
jgi:penicillin-binding protein 2